jgi:MFS family permease
MPHSRLRPVSTRFGSRDLALLAVGQAVSITGDSAALVALLLRLRPAGSGWVAALLAAELIPFIVFAPLSGRIVDRIDTRLVLLVALAGQALVAVPLALFDTPLSTVMLFAVLNALASFVRPATSALVPAVTGEDQAARGYARLATGISLGWIAGPALGGLVTGTLGADVALLLDAATFAILTALVALVRARRPGVRTTDRSRPSAAVGGLGLLWRTRVLRVALLVSAVATGCAVIDNVAAPFRFIDQLGTDDLGYSLYLTTWSAGALLGVQLLPRLRSRHHADALVAGNLVMGLAVAGIGLAPTFVVALSASALGGLGNGLQNVTQKALIAAHIPRPAHGRAFAAAGATMQSAIGAGTAAAAPLVAALGAGHAMALAGMLSAGIAVAGLAMLATRSELSGATAG